ncbi:MAG: PAS domain S-box protein [Candidatus Binataceae bacterium]
MRWGAALLVALEIAYFVLDISISPPLTPAIVALHAGAAGFSTLVLALTTSKWFERNWRPVCFANLLAIYGLTLGLRLLTGEIAPLFITVAFTLIGAGALLRWSARWQAGLSAIALWVAAWAGLMRGSVDPQTAYQFLSVALAIILGHFILAMRERHRAELIAWMDRLRTSRQVLTEALAESAAIMAEREIAERRLREGEAMLRTVFDSAPDNIAITRMSDGATLEVNREFLKTGYTREEILGVAAAKVGRWNRPQLRELVRRLRAHGSVRNLEAELRNKDGRVVPSLVSAAMVELGGEQCVISMARDITDLKRTQHELTRAREVLAVELRELEINRRQLATSEDKLRKVLEASGDVITINDLKTGHYLDVNQVFCDVMGYTRKEVLGRSALELGMWVYPDEVRNLLHLLKTEGRARNLECTFRMKDGRLADHLVSASLIRLGGETCIVSATRDVSELKRTERELRAAREALAVELRELEVSQSQLRREITDRELAQHRLQESEQTLRRIFEASLDSITIKRLSDGRYLEVNNAFFDVTGYSREEALGKTADDLDFWVDRAHEAAVFERIRAERVIRNVEADFRVRGGRIVSALVSSAVVDLGGEPCVVSIARDIGELKQTERELISARETLEAHVAELSETQDRLQAEMAEREVAQRRVQESEQTLRKIFETSFDAIVVNRWPDLTFVDFNERHFQIFGISKERALAAPPRSFRLWALADEFRRFRDAMNKHGFVQNMEAEFMMQDGSVRPFLCSSVLVDLSGEQCAISTLRDISELKQTEHELIAAREAALAASEAKSHFLSVMSHEIRTPMNAVLGMADLLWETSLTAEQRRYLDTMRNNGTSLLNLVNGILDLSKVESGRLSLEHADFDLVELAEDVMETLRVRAHEKGLELALRIPSTFSTALIGDPLRLRQILINLLSNAIKFTERGEVTLTIEAVDSAEPDDSIGAQPRESLAAPAAREAASPAATSARARCQLLRFAVHDTGIGIPAKQQDAIFANFIQGDSTVSRKYGGTGLGLAIVKRLVELMNGKITVESSPREGSTFSFTIALELQPATVRPPAYAGMARLAGRKVLVADGSSTNRAILAELLALAGAEVFLAADGAGALSELVRAREAGQPYDAILAANRMPEPDGAGIAQQIMSASHTAREGIVLMLTANDLNSQLGRLRERALQESQRCRYVLKPVRRGDLWTTVAAVCAGAVDEHALHNDAATPSVNDRGASHDFRLKRATPSRAAVVLKKPLRILLAEDSPDNRLLVEAYLKDTPYQLDHAENGEVAVHKFMTGHYDAILMDIQMPVMDGYEAVAEIRRLEQGDHRRPTPIIALTASAHDEAVRRSLKMGCDAHVTKPVKRSTLLETIRGAVEPAVQGAPSGAAMPANGAGGTEMVPDQPIVVQIDQDLSDLVPGFLGRKREDARALRSAVERGDADTIARLGHKMKGEGGSYGLDAITDFGRDLEQAGKEKDFDAAQRLGRDLTDFLERLEIVYRPVEE